VENWTDLSARAAPPRPSRRTFLTLAGTVPLLSSARLENLLFALCMDTHDEKKRTLAEQA
jgi:hypothetical protein